MPCSTALKPSSGCRKKEIQSTAKKTLTESTEIYPSGHKRPLRVSRKTMSSSRFPAVLEPRERECRYVVAPLRSGRAICCVAPAAFCCCSSALSIPGFWRLSGREPASDYPMLKKAPLAAGRKSSTLCKLSLAALGVSMDLQNLS